MRRPLEGLHPSSRGERVHFSGNRRTLIDGPFAETRELGAEFTPALRAQEDRLREETQGAAKNKR